MYGEQDEFYFHYTTGEAAFEHILPSRRLRLSPPATPLPAALSRRQADNGRSARPGETRCVLGLADVAVA